MANLFRGAYLAVRTQGQAPTIVAEPVSIKRFLEAVRNTLRDR